MSFTDSTMINDMTKSVDQWVSQLSLANTTIPKIDESNVFEFINEFERVTVMLPEDKKCQLLVKAFPPGRQMAWYEKHISPLKLTPNAWKLTKQKLIEKYSDTTDRDRHFSRLKNLKFVDNGLRRLSDHVEDLLYSFERAFPNEKDDDTKIRFIKSHLPSAVKSQLCLIQDYNFANNMDEFMRGIKQFDRARAGRSSSPEVKKEEAKVSELTSLVQQLIKEFKSEGEATRNVLATFRDVRRSQTPTRHQSPGNHSIRDRSKSPNRGSFGNRPQSLSQLSVDRTSRKDNFRQTNNNTSQSDTYQNNRSFESTYHQNNQGYQQPQHAGYQKNFQQPNYMHNNANFGQNSSTINQPVQRKVFDEEAYARKFGTPPRPCVHCGLNHFDRHCVHSLN